MPTPTNLASFVPVNAESSFSLANLPYGVFTSAQNSIKHIGVAIGEYILDVTELEKRGFFTACYNGTNMFDQGTLLPLMQAGKLQQQAIRHRVQHLLSQDCPELRDNPALLQIVLVAQTDASMHLPGVIPDYTDFYSSIDHATNVGRLFRDKDNPLLPNYRHIPVGYHGRASSIIPTNQTIKRPVGQVLPKDADTPIFSPCKALDFELEMAFLIGKGNTLGQSIPIASASEHIFGLVLLNDWSARDIQKWEYVPLGPFLSKSFATSISPWVVTLEALEPFKVKPRAQTPTPLPYLCDANDVSYDIQLEVAIKTSKMAQPEVICRSNFSYLYWTMAQQLAHHTVNGCNTRSLDLMASGTISGPEPGSYGCLLELTQGGAQPLTLSNGETRTYLQDGDEIIMSAYCQGDGYRVGFGSVSGIIGAA